MDIKQNEQWKIAENKVHIFFFFFLEPSMYQTLSIPLSVNYTRTRAERVSQLTVIKVDTRSQKSNSGPHNYEAHTLPHKYRKPEY